MKLHLVTANAMELCKLISGKSEEDEEAKSFGNWKESISSLFFLKLTHFAMTFRENRIKIFCCLW